MVDILKLAIEDEGTSFSLQCAIKSDSYYDNVFLDKILIDTQDTYSDSGPSTSAYTLKTFESNTKSYTLDKDTSIPLDLKNNIIYVWIVTKGTPSSDTPCGQDNVNTLGVAVYIKSIYEGIMCTLSELANADDCSIPKNFINKYLQYKGLIYALDTKHYAQANSWYSKFFTANTETTINTGCSCGK